MKEVNVLLRRRKTQLKQVKTVANEMTATEFSFETVSSRKSPSCLRKLPITE